ncbi:MAG: flagellar biosynthesis protein FlgD [Planctomycetes bacterium]|nr:flagellar biosynthesis protein FlgD [Planctomycetota bacterium]
MSRIPSLGTSSDASNTAGSKSSRDLRDVDIDQFLGLLIAELQNQDPLNPMDNAQLLQQISQIREISATNQLSDTLTAVHNGQSLATASALIGKEIRALSDDNKEVQGVVDRVTLSVDAKDSKKQEVKLRVGTASITPRNIREILD